MNLLGLSGKRGEVNTAGGKLQVSLEISLLFFFVHA